MPRAASSISSSHAASANILKRNQACHQCRRRKLKCDAQRPCSTCVRSHSNARAMSAPALVPIHPECTYDEIPEPRPQAQDPPKNRYQKLESRLNELETLLKEKEREARGDRMVLTPPLTVADSFYESPMTTARDAFGFVGYGPSLKHTSEERVGPYPPTPRTTHYPSIRDHETLLRLSFASMNNSIPASEPYHTPQLSTAGNSPANGSDLVSDIYWSNWHPKLPSLELLQHLIEVFFNSVSHASRILHRESFTRSLMLPPTDPGFPERSLLHAICAVASLFTNLVAPPPLPDLEHRPADEVFFDKYRQEEHREDSFGERQAAYAKEAQRDVARHGDGIFSGIQSVIILGWYYLYNARWLDVWMSTEEALRFSVPVGLSVCEPLVPLVRTWKVYTPLIPPPQNPMELEIRRNTFWLAYAANRLHAATNDFAVTLDDEDITQVLPCVYTDIVQAKTIPSEQRQRLRTPNVLTTHPEGQTDSFVLYIKATVLLSKVKTFNVRYKARFPKTSDPRDDPAFKALEILISTFQASFPLQFRDPISTGARPDSHLYLAHLIPYMAMMLLHDPHVDMSVRDKSREKLLESANAILHLTYSLFSTNYDIILLDPVVVWCWYTAAYAFVQEMRQAEHNGQTSQAAALRSQIDVFRMGLGRFGERFTVGYRQAKMLDDLFVTEGSPSTSLPPAHTPAMNSPNNFSLDHLDPQQTQRGGEQLMYQ